MSCSVIQTVKLLVLFLSSYLVQSTNETIPYSSIYNDRDSFLTYAKLHKCFCSANQALFNDVCENDNTSVTGLIDEYSSTTQVIGTDLIKRILVEELNCPPNYLNLTLPGDSFALQTSGELFNINYGLNLGFSKYCVEHIINEQKEIYMEVHLCLPIPEVPKCCPDNLRDSITKTCNNSNDSDVVVTFMLGTRSFQMKTESFPTFIKCEGNENKTRIPISSDSKTAQLKLTNEGLILAHRFSVVGSVTYIPSPEYCIWFNDEAKVAIYASYCYSDPILIHLKTCSDSVCVRKCCSPNEVFDMVSMKCVSVIKNEQWTPNFYNPISYDNEVESPSFKRITGFPLDCEYFSLSPNNDPPDVIKLLSNGSLYVENWDLALPSYHYCIDNFKTGNGILQGALVCFLESSEASGECKKEGSVLYPVLLIISCLFLGVTLVVYAIIPDLHAKVQGKCLIASVISLLSAYICLVIVQLSSLTDGVCTAIGFLMQFSLLSSFVWLNVMAFDIWRTLRSMQSGRESPSGARRRFLLYSLYAWGCPLMIGIVTAVMEFLPDSVDTTNLILPRFGETECFFPFYDKKPLWLYFYGFISIILIVNMVFFIHLAVILIKARKISESALGKKTELHKEWAKLYLKLFLIMGITWIFEVTSWMEGSCGFWIVTDIINSLRGLLIFIIFVCKRDVIKKLLSESSPVFHRMTTTVRQSSLTLFSRSSKRTSNFYVDPTTTSGTNEVINTPNHANANL